MKPALLLVDLQNDFLRRKALHRTTAQRVIGHIEHLLARFREQGFPVLHVHTRVRADGSDRMPHWQAQERLECVEGTEGAMPPPSLSPAAGEAVIVKRSFSGFENGELHESLRLRGVDCVVLAGLFTHACIRATAIDAYALRYVVRIAEDCVASTEPAHAELSKRWMDKRGMRFASSAQLLFEFGLRGNEAGSALAPAPLRYYNPSHVSELLATVTLWDAGTINVAVQNVCRAQEDWARVPPTERALVLHSWARRLEADRDRLTRLLAQEIGKPVTDAAEELNRAVELIGAANKLLILSAPARRKATDRFQVNYRPVGTVALITPWNNPLAIPAGKIAPALAFGNGVVWKPAPEASRTTEALLEHLKQAGLPSGVLRAISGDGAAARAIVEQPGIAAVSFTGSTLAGEQVAAICSVLRKPVQAELGGNNAAIVMAGVNLEPTVDAIAISAFSFAGQRCTATRRIIVDREIRDAFLHRLVARVKALVVGEPLNPATQVGPVISRAELERVRQLVETVVSTGEGRLLCGGTTAPGLVQGNWYLPTLIECDSPDARIVQEETFGPVAVVMIARDFGHAMELCNGVDAGLIASFYSPDAALQQRFLDTAQAGILRVNPKSFPVHADAPFLGWKSSGIGPAEHGRWDLEFYSRPQAVYGHEPAPPGTEAPVHPS